MRKRKIPSKIQPPKYLLRLLAKARPTHEVERTHPSLNRIGFLLEPGEVIDPTSKARTACHEAGHAVACRRLFRDVGGEVTIVPDPIKGTVGLHKTVELPDDNIDSMEKQVLYTCAGYAACAAAGMPDKTARLGCGQDFERAEAIIAKWGLAPLHEHLEKTVNFMRRPENLRAVRRLANELLIRETMDGDYVDLLIRVVDQGTCEAEAELEIYKMNRSFV